MKTRTLRLRSVQVFATCLLAAGLILGLTWVLAQAASPPPPAHPLHTAPAVPWDEPALNPFHRPDASTGVSIQNAALGQPGLSFRYVRTFGETEVAYFDDPDHLNVPWGIGTDGTNVWIAELHGKRALKFTSTGTFVTQIGKAGFENYHGLTIAGPNDVAVDGSGNIWLVDRHASHILKFDSTGNYVSELGQPWNCGPGNDQFCNPSGIAFDSSSNIYVSEVGNHRIQVFDSSGSYKATIGVTGQPGTGNDRLNGPEHIFVYGNRLYIADSGNHRVQIFNIASPYSPVYEATIGVLGQEGDDNSHLSWPTGVAVDSNYIYVADSGNHRIQIFNRTTRAYVTTLGTGWGTGNTNFDLPTDVAVDTAGNIYVADLNNDRVQQFNSSRVYQRTYGTTGVPYITDDYHYDAPHGIAVDTSGNIIVTEYRGYRLVKLNATGVPQWTVGQAGVWGNDNTHFGNWLDDGPIAAAVDSSGNIYVADTSNHRVQKCTPTGSCSTFAGVTGESGSDNTHFDRPFGVAVDQAGNVYAGDRNNHRVQRCTPAGSCNTFAGVTGESGSDESHFNGPTGVTVDRSGNVYVADSWNNRVQKCTPGGSCSTFAGTVGESGYDFAHFTEPRDVAVDAQGRVYVADIYNNRVQVFDASGAYLTTIGGSWGDNTSQFREVTGVDVDSQGNVYIADNNNHRIQKFAPGVPGWKQVNINGFGDRGNWWVSALAGFGNSLYAGTYNDNGAEVWRMDGGWTQVVTPGFGNTNNTGINHLMEFDGYLYAGTNNGATGAEVWRSPNGSDWIQVMSQGFGNPTTNSKITSFGTFSNTLYAAAGTWDFSNSQGAEIWRTSDGLSWTNVVTGGFGDANNAQVLALGALDGYFYAGTLNETSGGELWCSSTGDAGSWTQVNPDGFGSASNSAVTALTLFDGYLYAGTRNWDTGAQVWRSLDGVTWTQVISDGFGGGWTDGWVDAFRVFDNALYAVTRNYATGVKVWRTFNGVKWVQVNPDGFGDSNNGRTGDGATAVAVFNSRLFISTFNPAHGGEVWRKTCPGDFDGDDSVTMQDLAMTAAAWRQEAGYYDLDGDGKVTIADIMRVAAAWGSTCQ